MKPFVRFAPSPTGELHLGGARTALFNFLFAKSKEGKFLLRIEDTDSERSKKKFTDQICDSLSWLGLEWDDELVFQSKRNSIYKHSIKTLLNTGNAYRCFASKKELDEIRQKSSSYHYPGIWRYKEKQEINRELETGKPYTIRLKTSNEGETQFDDIIYGSISINNSEIDDFIIARSDGSPVYNLTNVIDDKDMGITHVIRGEDHISNTAKQIMIYNAFGWEVPFFAHLPMILGEDKKRLSKRHGATGLQVYRDEGYQPEALLNHLALLGWNPGDEEEIMTISQLISKYDLSQVQKKGAVFDYKKLNWISSQHLSNQKNINILNNIRSIDSKWGKEKTDDFCLQVLELMKPRSFSLINIIEQSGYFFHESVEFNEKVVKKIWKNDAPKIAKNLVKLLSDLNHWDADDLEIHLKTFIEKNQLGYGKTMKVVRLALCGNVNGPSLFDILELLGKISSINRLNNAITNF